LLFNSYIFILFFLPVTLLSYFGLNRWGKEVWAKWVLVGMSLWFYAYFHISYLILMIGSILFNFFCSKQIRRQSGMRNKVLLAIGIAANVGVIFYFKYFNFFLENINTLFQCNFITDTILMPL